MEEYVLDAYPVKGGVKLILSGFKEEVIKTTFPVYVITENPEVVLQHPDVKYYEEEKWKTLEGKEVKLYRFEVNTFEAYYYMKKRLKVVNEIPTVLSQTLYRLGIKPFRRINQDEEKEFKIKVVRIVPVSWYGESTNSDTFEVNGEITKSEVEADVAECLGNACDHVKAPVKIRIEKKRSPVSVKGLIEWSYVSLTPIHEIAYATIGKALTTNEAWVAFKRKILIPKVVPRVEKLRKLEDIMKADKGGLILFPNPGCYDKVYQIDFSSMYPSLIVKYNISAETIDVCDDIKTELHSICLKEKGIVPEALEWLIKRKTELKEIDRERSEAIKWILVASFGYLGYRNSRFGKIEAYEMVTYFARKTLRTAIEIANNMGFKVLHGIVDSLVVEGDNVDKLIDKIEKETGLRLDYKKYNWIIFTLTRDNTPYPTRYLGKTEEGEMISKGLIRRNMPNIVKYFLNDSLKILSEAKSCNEVKKKIKNLRESLEYYKKRVINGEPIDYVMRVKGIPYVKGVRGFYDARLGFGDKDVNYYKEYLERTYEDLVKVFVC
ncbi:DNA polymerase II [Acidianus sulfidivorans JP7]|uniref:DNA-directed DNA polymerase n=1 Tax=Acidianus sulfidivorans JP7 TaxID=619593 RepID=A0A2U9IJU2_9CREN|nr:DNA polymerase domain-containing protein [Acidianus sulfidivorans]AWR96226.1 DNA polymerase II [Acidianus sulfidivorans JP7]